MKVTLIASNELRFEGENDAEKRFLRELHIALGEPRNAHYEMFRKVYPFRGGWWGRLFQRNRSSLWEEWLSINTRVGAATFHDGSLILTITERTNTSAHTPG